MSVSVNQDNLARNERGPRRLLVLRELPKGLSIVTVESRKDLKEFVRFPMKLYADCPHYVPPLIADELDTLDPKKCPVHENADARLFLAIRRGTVCQTPTNCEVVGRIAAIISQAVNDRWNTRTLRFSWFDCIDDYAVAAALFDAAEVWGSGHGMDNIVGPMGFNHLEKAGMLTSGYDTTPTMASFYNYPYYNDFVKRYGFTVDVGIVEYRLRNVFAQAFPPRVVALMERKQKGRYRVLEFTSRKQVMARAREVVALIESTYWDLYDGVPLTKPQVDYYIKKFFPYLIPELVKVAVNERDEAVGFFIAMPNISEALQRADGRLLPFGLYHLWKASRRGNKVLDFLLAGVQKEYRGRGIDIMMGVEMFKTAAKLGFECAETNLELETNSRVRSEWKHLDHVVNRRRAIYAKPIG